MNLIISKCKTLNISQKNLPSKREYYLDGSPLNTCLRCIFNNRWPEKIWNEDLWEQAGQELVVKQILRRKWDWIGHTLRKPASSTTCQALTWTRRGRGREVCLGAAGGETLRQDWSEKPRTECDGKGLSMAYAPSGTMGFIDWLGPLWQQLAKPATWVYPLPTTSSGLDS